MIQTQKTVIVGQGIAGSLLAWELAKKKEPFVVVDNYHKHSSSKVAAGLYNPLVFRKPTLSFNAEQVLPQAVETYQNIEQHLDARFFHPKTFIRLFKDYEAINNWEAKAGEEAFHPYLELPLIKESETPQGVKNKLPIGRVHGAGYVDLISFLNAMRTWLKNDRRLIEAAVVEVNQKAAILELDNGNTISAEKIILARGHKERFEELFNYTTVGATKGDVLTIECPDLKLEEVISKGFFILPIGNGRFKVGATFEWDNYSYSPSAKAREELSRKLDEVIDVPYQIIDQKSGLRPTAKDRRPLLGQHPQIPHLYLLNGLGSKGVLLAPLYAKQLIAHIFDGQPLDKEVDIKRMEKYYGNS